MSGVCSQLVSNVVGIHIDSPPRPPVPVSPTLSVCPGSSASLAVASPQAGLTYNWYSSPAETTLLFTGSSFVTGAIVSDTTFYVAAENGACSSASPAAIQVTLNNAPAAPTVTNAALTTCSGQAVNMSIANSLAGYTYNWYAVATGGTPLATGVEYTIPIAIETTTYYAEAVNGSGCVSTSRTPVNVTVNQLPIVTAVGTSICSGSTATLTASSSDANATINWYSTPSGGAILFSGSIFTTPALTGDTNYYVAAVDNGTGCSSAAPIAVPVTILPPLTAPVVVVSGSTSSTVTFQWTAITGATGYEVSTDSGKTFSAPSSGSNG